MNSEAQAALAELRRSRELASNNAHWLRDGRRACGLTLRVTIGTICMLHEIKNPVVTGHREPTDVDAIQLALFMSDEWRGDCMDAISGGSGAIEELTDLFARTTSRRNKVKMISAVSSLIGDLDEVTGMIEADSDCDENGAPFDPDWWISYAYCVARKTGWDEHYILWELPMYRVHAYAKMINIEHGEKANAESRVRQDVLDAMTKLQAAKEAENGKAS